MLKLIKMLSLIALSGLAISCQRNSNSNPSSPVSNDTDTLTEAQAIELKNVSYSDELIQAMLKASSVSAPGSEVRLATFKNYSGGSSSLNDLRDWGSEYSFTLPPSIQISSGQSGNHWVRFSYTPKDSETMICIYRGTGSVSSTAAGCSVPNGSSYQFDFCIGQSTFTELNCNSNPNSCRSHPSANAALGNTIVAAYQVEMYLANGDRCATTNTAMTLTNVVPKTNSLACGSTITHPDQLTGSSLDCRDHDGIALTIVGSDEDFNGKQFQILTGSKTLAGLLIKGDNSKIHNFQVLGDSKDTGSSIGVLGFDSNNLELSQNLVQDQNIGIDIYAAQVSAADLAISENQINNIDSFGIRVHKDDKVQVSNPKITDNDFSQIKQFAIRIKADSFEFDKSNKNKFTDVRSLLYLSHGDFEISDFKVNDSEQKYQAIFIDQAERIVVSDSDLTMTDQGTGYSVGIHIYNTKQVEIEDLTSKFGDVAIKINVDQEGIDTEVELSDLDISNQSTAGVMLQTSQKGSFGSVTAKDSRFRNIPSQQSIWRVPNYSGPDIKLDDVDFR